MQRLNTWGGFRPWSFAPREKGLKTETLLLATGSEQFLQRGGCGYTEGSDGLLD